MRFVIFHGLFGSWGWEQIDERGVVVNESRIEFESREECIADARAHGYREEHLSRCLHS